MTVTVLDADDFSLATFARVALGGEGVMIAPEASERMRRSFDAFQSYVADHPDDFIYGVTSGGGPDASRRATPEEMDRTRDPRFSWNIGRLAFGGEPLPAPLVRGALFASLRTMTSGFTSTPPRRAARIAERLDGDPPPVPSLGITAAGEILSNAALHDTESESLAGPAPEDRDAGFEVGTTNGAPMAAAQLALSAVLGAERLGLVRQVLALSVEAMRAPLDPYDPAMAELWGDAQDGDALREMAELLRGASTDDRLEEAPASFGVLPRIIGQAERALAQLRRCAEISLRQVSANPTFVRVPLDAGRQRVLANGGYHNAMAAAALDAMTAAWADLAAVAHRHAIKLHKGELTGLPDRLLPSSGQVWVSAYSTTYLEYVPNDFVAELRQLASTTLLLGGEIAASEQDDIAVNAFLAYRKLARAAPLLDATLAVLAATASQALHRGGRSPAPPLRSWLGRIRSLVPPVDGPRLLGPECDRLAAWITDEVTRRALESAIALDHAPTVDR